MDQPQADYFTAIAKAMPQGANIILCSAEPGWYKAEQNGDSFRTLSYAAWIAENAGQALRIPLILSGDTHHYSRYSGPKGSQYITSGGGGAFLHGTHGMPEEIRADWLRDAGAVLSLKTEPDGDHKPCAREALWPARAESRKLLWGNLKFPVSNWDFALLLGGIYWLLAFALSQLPRGDVMVLVGAVPRRRVHRLRGVSGGMEAEDHRAVADPCGAPHRGAVCPAVAAASDRRAIPATSAPGRGGCGSSPWGSSSFPSAARSRPSSSASTCW